MARTIREIRTGDNDTGDVYFLITRDRWTIIRNSAFAAVIGGVWILVAGLVYAASSSLLSWTLIIPAIISWAIVQYVFTIAKLGVRIDMKNGIVEILQIGFIRRCEIDKCTIRDVVVGEKYPVGREKRNEKDIKHYLGMKLVDGTVVSAFYDLKKSVLENARTAILSALNLEIDTRDDDGNNDNSGDNNNNNSDNDDAAAGVASAEAEDAV